jgi:hypothetical protein
MTTPDIAGLCERLKTLWLELNDAHAKPPATARIMNALHQSGVALERQAAENKRLRKAAKAFESAVTTDIPAGPGYAEWVAKAQQARAALQAALTGEDTTGLPTSQNTELGLAFSDAGEP